MKKGELKSFLDEKAAQYESISFLAADPIQIPHQFSSKEDIEISAFLVATIAWGNRKSIINNGNKMMHLMDNSPHDFILHHQKSDLKRFDGFVHRTFNADDLRYFIQALQQIYTQHDGLGKAICSTCIGQQLAASYSCLQRIIFHPSSSETHAKTCFRPHEGFRCEAHQYVFALDDPLFKKRSRLWIVA